MKNKATTLLNGLKTVIKYGAVVMAIITICQFAVKTFEDLKIEQDEPDKDK